MTPLRQQPLSPILTLISFPKLLAVFLLILEWRDLHALFNSCSAARTLFRSPLLRDLILARFVPGYLSSQPRDHDVYVSIHDLDLFLISQKFPLHYYPTYALRGQEATRLSALAMAHSRIVLLLQSLVHSSRVPLLPEPRDQLPMLLRQLTFPAPLSYKPSSSIRPSLSDSFSYRRLSLFRTTSPVLPPPAEPRALKGYTNSWRHSSPRRNGSADSKTTTTDSTSSVSRSTTPTSNPISTPPSPSSSVSSLPSSPHSLSLATSRARAPILRAYVPCTELSDGSTSVLLCEEQLLQAGLWSHLSAGDIVCNLGYVPDSDDALPSEYCQKWLIFNGSFLAPFSPGSNPLPLDDPLSLPSPFYYAHILPASPLANPVFLIPRMPMLDRHSEAPVLSLQLLSTKVPSAHSPNGVAIARKYMWTAIVERNPGGCDDGEDQEDQEYALHNAMGDGWYGEWVLETEGTKEGRQLLLDWLGGGYNGPPREWELVRERSGHGKKDSKMTVWLKLLHSRSDEEEASPQPSLQAHL
ncbi:hypothetical protein L208DRAFT_1385745 [Tricholoma matsutake]|nr:hypothetical protein L208DRAFT_1385745 [Tricholoma matsutake 945]